MIRGVDTATGVTVLEPGATEIRVPIDDADVEPGPGEFECRDAARGPGPDDQDVAAVGLGRTGDHEVLPTFDGLADRTPAHSISTMSSGRQSACSRISILGVEPSVAARIAASTIADDSAVASGR